MIRADGVHRAFGGVSVLRGVDLAVGAGELVTLSGPSGSGKTALLSLLCGFDFPDSAPIRQVADPPRPSWSSSSKSSAPAARRFSPTVRCEIRLSAGFWKTTAISLRRNARSSVHDRDEVATPCTHTSPRDGRSISESTRSRVDLPDPEGPDRTVRPGAIDSDTSATARTEP